MYIYMDIELCVCVCYWADMEPSRPVASSLSQTILLRSCCLALRESASLRYTNARRSVAPSDEEGRKGTGKK